MAIAFRASQFTANNTASTSCVITTPTVQTGDILVAVISYRDGDTNITPPADWTQVGESPQETGTGSADVGLAVYWRHVSDAGSEPASHTFTLSLSQRNIGALLSYSGCDTSAPIDDADGQTNASSTNHTIPSLDTTVANTMALWSVAVAVGMSNVGAPGGTTERIDEDVSALSLDVSEETIASSGSTGTRTATTGSSAVSAAIAIALKPSGGTTYTQNVSGSTSSAGALAKQISRPIAGTLTSTGALQRQMNKLTSGALSSSGALARLVEQRLAGSLTNAGALVRQVQRTITGSLDGAGALIRQAEKVLGGSLSNNGALTRVVSTSFSGALASSGALTAIRAVAITLVGSMNSSGALTRQTQTQLGGTLPSTGSLTKIVMVGLSGIMGSSGSLVRLIGKVLSGALTSTGALIAQVVAGVGELLPYRGDIAVYDDSGATGTIAGGTVMTAATTSPIGSIAGAAAQPSEMTYDTPGGTGSVTGGTVLPPEQTL